MTPGDVRAELQKLTHFVLALWLWLSVAARAEPAPDLPGLLQTLKGTNETEGRRVLAARALAEIGSGSPHALRSLVQILINRAESPALRLSAVIALKQISTNEQIVVPALMVILKDKREIEGIRVHAVEAYLAISSDPRVFAGDFAKILGDTNETQIVRRSAAKALESISDRIGFKARKSRWPSAEITRAVASLDQLLKAFDAANTRADSEIGRVFRSLQTQRESLATSASFSHFVIERRWNWVIGALLLPVDCLLVWLLLLWRSPLWLWRLNEALRLLPEIRLPAWPNLPIGFRGYLLLSLFQYHPRVLDAWLGRHWLQVSRRFDAIRTVSNRRLHLPLPVLVNGSLVVQPSPAHFRAAFEQERLTLIIAGEGGSGKTSLACQIARWAMAEQSDERLAAHRMLPVFIEHGWSTLSRNGSSSLPETIHRQAQSLLGEDEPISPELLEQLLLNKRILLIIDQLPEFSEERRRLIDGMIAPSLRAGALVVTAQSTGADLAGETCPIVPCPIEPDSIAEFLSAYLKQSGKRDLFTDREFLEACVRLSEMAGDRAITLLLARTYADQMIAAKEAIRTRPLPGNIPDLFVSWLHELNRGVPKEQKLNGEIVERLMRAIAWECVKGTFQPATARLSDLMLALPEEPELREKLAYCCGRLELVQRVDDAGSEVRMTSGPLAEYLGALRSIELLGPDENAWRDHLAELRTCAGSPTTIRSFILALRDCCLVKHKESDIPAFVLSELARLAASELSAVEQTRLRLRIHRLVQQLELPNAEDRRNAVALLGAIGPGAKAAIPALVARLKNGHEPLAVRHTVLKALGEIGSETDDVIPALIEALQDRHHRLRLPAARALVGIGDQAISSLAGLLRAKQGDEEFRVVLAATLGEFEAQGEAAIPALVEVLCDKEELARVRAAAADALGRMGPQAARAAPDLVDLMEESKPLCRSAAKALIGIAPSARPSVIALFEALNRERSNESEEALATFRLSLAPACPSSKLPSSAADDARVRQILETALTKAKGRRASKTVWNRDDLSSGVQRAAHERTVAVTVAHE